MMRILGTLALLAALVGCGPAANSSSPGIVVAPAQPEDWIWLFNGSDTSAWAGLDGTPFPTQTWVVEDGLLRTTEDASGGDLQTIEDFGDFELIFDWKIEPGGNSGVKYGVQEEWVSASFRPDLSEERKARTRLQAVGLEFQMIDDSILDHSKSDWELSATGAIYLLAAPPQKKVNPPGEWNSTRILVKGADVEHWLNGEKILSVQLGSEEILDQVERTKFRKMPGYGRPGQGAIVLQHHGKPAWFRDIKIRRL